MALIEVLPDVFYDTDEPWYEQPTELLDLAEQVMKEDPIDSDIETLDEKSRMIWGEWETTTTEGVFKMVVNMQYLYSIESRAYEAKQTQNVVVVEKIS